jgi:hypothetical protein
LSDIFESSGSDDEEINQEYIGRVRDLRLRRCTAAYPYEDDLVKCIENVRPDNKNWLLLPGRERQRRWMAEFRMPGNLPAAVSASAAIPPFQRSYENQAAHVYSKREAISFQKFLGANSNIEADGLEMGYAAQQQTVAGRFPLAFETLPSSGADAHAQEEATNFVVRVDIFYALDEVTFIGIRCGTAPQSQIAHSSNVLLVNLLSSQHGFQVSGS